MNDRDKDFERRARKLGRLIGLGKKKPKPKPKPKKKGNGNNK